MWCYWSSYLSLLTLLRKRRDSPRPSVFWWEVVVSSHVDGEAVLAGQWLWTCPLHMCPLTFLVCLGRRGDSAPLWPGGFLCPNPFFWCPWLLWHLGEEERPWIEAISWASCFSRGVALVGAAGRPPARWERGASGSWGHGGFLRPLTSCCGRDPTWCHLAALVSLGGIGESQARGEGCQFPWLLVNLILLVVVDSCSARGVTAFLGCLFLLGWELGNAGPVSLLLSGGGM